MSAVADAVLVVANPASGTFSRAMVDTVVRRMSAAGATVEPALTEGPGHARELAAKAAAPGGPGTVVSIGGDGTAHEVMTGLLGQLPRGATGSALSPGRAEAPDRLPALLVLPSGTGNSFYREIWSDRPWQSALEAAATAPRTRSIDLARVAETGDLVLLGASSGLVAQALITARQVTESGRDRYDIAVAETLRTFRPYPGRVVVDGRTVHTGDTVFVTVGGGRHRGGRFKLLPNSVLDDGLLDVCAVGTALSLRELPGLARDGEHLGREGVVDARGRQVVIERTDGLPLVFEYDGDVRGTGRDRFTLDVVPRSLRVLTPA